jgi:hypothetical protein
MHETDYIGKRGEVILRFLFTEWCDGEPWFDDNFLGEKQPIKDFIVNLIEPSRGAMNESSENKFIVSRAQTVAREFLTRRPEAVIHPFDGNDLDLVVTLDPSASLEIPGFSPFGVFVWGTNQSISSGKVASNFATRRWKSERERSNSSHTYLLPVIALLYSVKEDIGYYAWISEPLIPQDGPPKLIPNEDLHCTLIMRNSMDKIVQKVAGWYTRLSSVLLSA